MLRLETKRGEADIAADGHRALSSESEPDLGQEKVQINEGAVMPDVQRKTLPYSRAPLSRRRRPSGIVNEAMGPEASVLSPEEPMLDVAVASFGETNVLEAAIGNDDRVRVADPLMRANPWRQICALRIRSKTGRMYVGTAWFIAPRVLAT